jgi:copper chaperone CopZ
METIKLIIPDMKSPHCQMTVSNAIKSAGGNVRSVSTQQAELLLPKHIAKEAVVDAIKKAGYQVF